METKDQNQKNADRQYQVEKYGMYLGIIMNVVFLISVSYILITGFETICDTITLGFETIKP